PTQGGWQQQGTQQGGWGQQAPAAAPQPQGTGGWGAPQQAAPQQGGWGAPAPAAPSPAPQGGGWGAPAPAPAPDPTGQALFDALKRKGVDPTQFQSEEQAKQAWQYVKNNPEVARWRATSRRCSCSASRTSSTRRSVFVSGCSLRLTISTTSCSRRCATSVRRSSTCRRRLIHGR